MNIQDVLEHLNVLLGLQLSIARRAGNMRNFQFGPIRVLERGSIGRYALHIQCPRRLEGPATIITGFSDLWEPFGNETDIDWDTWNYDTNDNVQDVTLHSLFGDGDASTQSAINRTDSLVVEAIVVDSYGSFVLSLSGNYRLVVFPTGTQGEHWRFFQPHTNAPHLVSEHQAISLHTSDEE